MIRRIAVLATSWLGRARQTVSAARSPQPAAWRHDRLRPSEMYPIADGTVKARFVVLRSGVRVRVAECGPASGSPVLMLHGWGGSVYGFRKNMPALCAAGYRVIAADLLGHGLSDKPLDVERYSWAGQLAQVSEIMDALELERATLIGQSMGGHLALGFAREHAARVSAVAVINASGLGRIAGIDLLRALARMPPSLHLPITTRRFMVKVVMKYAYGRLGRFTERDVDEYWAPSQFPEWGRVLVTLLRVARWSRVPPGEFAELTQPTLVIFSSDRVCRVGDEAELRMRIPPSSTIVRVPVAGHLVNEEAPEPVNAALLAFLEVCRPLPKDIKAQS